MTTEHKLVRDSLHDAQAHCACGRWSFSRVGEATPQEIERAYRMHTPLWRIERREEVLHRVRLALLAPRTEARAQWLEDRLETALRDLEDV